jgi:hypothetical protein
MYKTTNLKNGKIYIGVHRTKNVDDGYLGSGVMIKRSILKYGKQCFKKEILQEFESVSAMYDAERNTVTTEFINRPDVYNLRVGGWGGKITEQTRQKISKALLGKKKTDQMKEKLRNARTGTKLKESTKNKIQNSRNENKDSRDQIWCTLFDEWKNSGLSKNEFIKKAGYHSTTTATYNWVRLGLQPAKERIKRKIKTS